MPITVTPETFAYVSFDAPTIERIASDLAASLGMAEQTINISVDETTPLARTVITLNDESIDIHADSGAFEDTRKPRQQSEVTTATSLGRVLLRARDRQTGGFGEAPRDGELTLPQIAAWETYSIGRLEKLGVPVNRQRWLYNFRNRHGFSDASDGAFEQLWDSDGLTWGELCAISDRAITATRAPV
jgi:hypothetical protein